MFLVTQLDEFKEFNEQDLFITAHFWYGLKKVYFGIQKIAGGIQTYSFMKR